MKNSLLLQSKNPIPFIEAQLTIHNPTINEISLIGEESFHTGARFLNFSKDTFLSSEDKIHLENKSNFEVFMSIVNDKKQSLLRKCVNDLFLLLFPDYDVQIVPGRILMKSVHGVGFIDDRNFDAFKDIISSMFCLKELQGTEKYNPADGRAAKIAEKFKKRDQKLAKNKGESQKISLLDRYVSVLAVGEQKDKNELMNYTVYQLVDEFKRFILREEYNHIFQARLAGAQDLKDADSWYDELHLS